MTFNEILNHQQRAFRKTILRDYTWFKKNYHCEESFSVCDLTSTEFEIQKFFDKRLEHYIRTILVNGVICHYLEEKGVAIIRPNLTSSRGEPRFFSNREYEELAKFEFIADFGAKRVAYLYTTAAVDSAKSLISDGVADEIRIISWNHQLSPSRSTPEVTGATKAKLYTIYSELDFFKEQIGEQEYYDYICFLTGEIYCFQQYIGVKTITSLSTYKLASFRFDEERKLLEEIERIKQWKQVEENIMAAGLQESMPYGYTIIEESTREKSPNLEKQSKELLIKGELLTQFEAKKMYKYLLGRSHIAKSFLTAEYLYQQYDSSDCFDYTAIISGYLKSIEQLLFTLAEFSINKGHTIKYLGGKNTNNRYPQKNPKDKKPNGEPLRKPIPYVDFTSENLPCIDTTIGSLTYYLEYNPELVLVETGLKEIFFQCIRSYTDECRNGAFHKHNVYTWNRVELVRRNTIFLYILLLAGCKKSENLDELDCRFQIQTKDRIDRLYYLISSKGIDVFLFFFSVEYELRPPVRVRYLPEESGYPTIDDDGYVSRIQLAFENISNKEKIYIFPQNIPEIVQYTDEDGTIMSF